MTCMVDLFTSFHSNIIPAHNSPLDWYFLCTYISLLIPSEYHTSFLLQYLNWFGFLQLHTLGYYLLSTSLLPFNMQLGTGYGGGLHMLNVVRVSGKYRLKEQIGVGSFGEWSSFLIHLWLTESIVVSIFHRITLFWSRNIVIQTEAFQLVIDGWEMNFTHQRIQPLSAPSTCTCHWP